MVTTAHFHMVEAVHVYLLAGQCAVTHSGAKLVAAGFRVGRMLTSATPFTPTQWYLHAELRLHITGMLRAL